MKRKILSWILSLAMILSAVPWSVAAEVEFEVEESAEKVEDVQAPVQKNGFFDNGSTTIELNDYVFYINGDDEDYLYKKEKSTSVGEAVLERHIISIVSADKEKKSIYLVEYIDQKSRLLKMNVTDCSVQVVCDFDGIVTCICVTGSTLFYIDNNKLFSYSVETHEKSMILDDASIAYLKSSNVLKCYLAEGTIVCYDIDTGKKSEQDAVLSSTSFTPRLTAPETTNPYYTTKNVFHQWGWGMVGNGGNCTCYAFGRAYEVLGTEPKLSHGDAGGWYSYNVSNGYYSYSSDISKPVPGAVVVWSQSGAAGHVAFVEIVDGDTVITSESGWGNYYFKTFTRSIKQANLSENGKTFLGYIYVCGQNAVSSNPYSTITPGNYYLVNNNSYLTVTADNNNSVCSVSAQSGSTNQLFSISANSRFSNGYTIKTLHYSSGRALNVFTSGVSSNGDNVTLYTSTSDASQTWKFEAKNGGYIIHPADNTGLALTNSNGSTKVMTSTGASNQIWNLTTRENRTLTYNHNGGSGSIPSSVTVPEGTTVTIGSEVPTRYGYNFLGWWVQGAEGFLHAGNSFVLTHDLTLYAYWGEKTKYYISYDANGGSGAPLIQSKYEGETITLSSVTPTRTGYTFAGWTVDNGSGRIDYNPGSQYINNSSVTLYAVWKRIFPGKPSVTIASANFTEDQGLQVYWNNVSNCDFFEFHVCNTDTDERVWVDWVVTGTSYDLALQPGNYRVAVVAMNTVVSDYPAWTYSDWVYFTVSPKYYTFTYNANGGTDAPAPQTKRHGQNLTITSEIPSRPGYIFKGWAGTTETGVELVPGQVCDYNYSGTFFAVWEKAERTVTIDPEGGSYNGSSSMVSLSGQINDTLTLSVPTRPGYRFLGWASGGEQSVFPYGKPCCSSPFLGRLGSYNNGVYNGYDGNVSIDKVSCATPWGDTRDVWEVSSYGTTDPGCGGFNQYCLSKPGGVFYHVFVAKIPVGYTANSVSNAVGNGASFEWITSNKGTGEWQTYIYKLTCGTEGSFADFGYVYLNGVAGTREAPLKWQVAYSQIYDATDFPSDSTTLVVGTEDIEMHALWESTLPEKPRVSVESPTVPENIDFTVFWSPARYADWYEVLIFNYDTGETTVERNVYDTHYTTSLPAGNYTFQITAINRERVELGIDYSNSEYCSVSIKPQNGFSPSEVLEANGHVYWIFEDYFSYPTAKAYCEALGGHLATVTDEAEQQLLVGSRTLSETERVGFYLGASDEEEEGVWKWVTGEPFEYSNWYSGQPDNAWDYHWIEGDKRYEDYLMIYNSTYAFGWNDALPNLKSRGLGFICEFDPHTVTYHAEDGENVPSTQKKVYGQPLVLSSEVPTRAGHTFVGWARSENGAVAYAPGDCYALEQDLTLYAVWKQPNALIQNVLRKNGVLTLDVVWNDRPAVSVLVAAAYNNGRLMELHTKEAPSATEQVSFDSTATEVKVYYVDSMQTFSPLAPTVHWTAKDQEAQSTDFYDVELCKDKETCYLKARVRLEYKDRTDDSIQMRIVWTQLLSKQYAYAKAQAFYVSIDGVSTETVAIGSESEWSKSSSYDRAKTVYSNWLTVPVSEKQDTVSVKTLYLENGESSVIWEKAAVSIPISPIKRYKLLFLAGEGSVSETERRVICGDTVGTLPVPVRTGYNFYGWFTAEEGGTQITAQSSFDEETEITLYAVWVPKEPGKPMLSIGKTEYSVGETLSCTWNNVENADYYEFHIIDRSTETRCYADWKINGTNHAVSLDKSGLYRVYVAGINAELASLGKPYYTMSDEINFVVYANASLNANGGSVSTSNIKVLCGNTYGTLPTPTRAGYSFDGWYTAASGGSRVTENTNVTSTSEHILYAHWSARSYTITFTPNGGTVSYSTKSVTYDGTYGDLPSATRAGYNFTGWYTSDGTLITSSTEFKTASNVTLVAHWSEKTLTLYYNANGGSVSPTSKSVTYNHSYGSLATPERTGYTFTGWYTAASGGSEVSSSTMVTSTGDHTIYAHWSAKNYTYNIIYKSSNGTSLGSSEITFAYNTTNTISPKAFAGYDTPSSQSITWNSVNAKTITFVYTPSAVAYTTVSGSQNTGPNVTYNIEFQYQNRTANSVQIRVVWTSTIQAGWSGFNHGFRFATSTNGVKVADTWIVRQGEWNSGFSESNSNRSKTGTSEWATVPVSPDTTSVSTYTYVYQANYSGGDLTSYGYNCNNPKNTWTVNIPKY